jgi:hypothetical protein
MVLGHPRQEIVLGTVPAEPIHLSAHGKRMPDVGDRIHWDVAGLRRHDLASDCTDARFERSHALGSEDGVDDGPERGVFWRVETVEHRPVSRRCGRECRRIISNCEYVGMSEQRDPERRPGHGTRGSHAVVGSPLIGQRRF